MFCAAVLKFDIKFERTLRFGRYSRWYRPYRLEEAFFIESAQQSATLSRLCEQLSSTTQNSMTLKWLAFPSSLPSIYRSSMTLLQDLLSMLDQNQLSASLYAVSERFSKLIQIQRFTLWSAERHFFLWRSKFERLHFITTRKIANITIRWWCINPSYLFMTSI